MSKLDTMITLLQRIEMRLKYLEDYQQVIATDGIVASSSHYEGDCLAGFLGQMYSQNNEDGIISEIFRRLKIKDGWFMDIGAGNVYSNTRLLLETGWSGVWVDGDVSGLPAMKGVEIRQQIVTPENVNDLFKWGKYDFLNLDIDMNTHHVWEAFTIHRPTVVCVEYNGAIPPSTSWAIPYTPDKRWEMGTNESDQYGASLKYLENLGREKGYTLIGCDYNGVNAFFVIEEHRDHFIGDGTAEFHYEAPKFRVQFSRGHRGTHTMRFRDGFHLGLLNDPDNIGDY